MEPLECHAVAALSSYALTVTACPLESDNAEQASLWERFRQEVVDLAYRPDFDALAIDVEIPA